LAVVDLGQQSGTPSDNEDKEPQAATGDIACLFIHVKLLLVQFLDLDQGRG